MGSIWAGQAWPPGAQLTLRASISHAGTLQSLSGGPPPCKGEPEVGGLKSQQVLMKSQRALTSANLRVQKKVLTDHPLKGSYNLK